MAFLLEQDLVVHRIGNLRHPFLTGEGAALVGGRWNSPARRVVYTSASLALAVLEYLVNAQTMDVPVGYGRVEVTIPRGVSADRIELRPEHIRGGGATRRIGDQWLKSGASLVLFVPAFPVNGREQNLLLNPLHPEFRLVSSTAPERMVWDTRLFRPATDASPLVV